MRILTAIVALTAVMILPGCATLQQYPAFGTVSGGRLVLYDRQGAHNVLPPSGRNLAAEPSPAARASRPLRMRH